MSTEYWKAVCATGYLTPFPKLFSIQIILVWSFRTSQILSSFLGPRESRSISMIGTRRNSDRKRSFRFLQPDFVCRRHASMGAAGANIGRVDRGRAR